MDNVEVSEYHSRTNKNTMARKLRMLFGEGGWGVGV